jgi:hypothetical protein
VSKDRAIGRTLKVKETSVYKEEAGEGVTMTNKYQPLNGTKMSVYGQQYPPESAGQLPMIAT